MPLKASDIVSRAYKPTPNPIKEANAYNMLANKDKHKINVEAE